MFANPFPIAFLQLFLSSGDQLVSSGAEGNLCIYDATREYAPAKILATPVARRHVAMTATGDGSELATVARDGMSIVLYNTLDWAQVRSNQCSVRKSSNCSWKINT